MKSLEEIIKTGESKTIEFKEFFPSNIKIAKTIIAFANTAGGKLIIGVNDESKIVGLEDIDIFEWQDRISSILYDSCHPNIMPEFYTSNIAGKMLFIVEVSRGSLLPYYLKTKGKNEGTYIRIGATNRIASFDNIVDLERQRRNLSFDEEIDYDIDYKSINYDFLKKEYRGIGKEINVEKLKNLKLLKEENNKIYPTKAFLILSGLYENCVIKCSKFKGNSVDFFVDRKEFTGNIFSLLDNAEKFIKNHINLRGEIIGLRRTDTLEIPETVIREVLVNALIHRDYSNFGRDIKVAIFDESINVISPGGFPNSIILEEILLGRSEIRNKIIAKISKELNLIEQWGTGIQRIFLLCENAGLKKPIVRESGDFVEFILFRKTKNKKYWENIESSSKDEKIAEDSKKVAESHDRLETDYGSRRPNNDRLTKEEMREHNKDESSIKEGKVASNSTKVEGKNNLQNDRIATEYNGARPNSDRITTENQILEFIEIHQKITKKMIKKLLNVKDTKAKEEINKLINKNLLERKGGGRSTYYVLKSQELDKCKT